MKRGDMLRYRTIPALGSMMFLITEREKNGLLSGWLFVFDDAGRSVTFRKTQRVEWVLRSEWEKICP